MLVSAGGFRCVLHQCEMKPDGRLNLRCLAPGERKMCRLLLLLLPVVCLVAIAAGSARCPRSTSTNFAATHHHRHNKPNGGNGKGKQGRRKGDRGGSDPADSEDPEEDRETRSEVTCDSSYKYRLANGSCNNLNNPTWGSVGQTYRRLMDPVYDDGTNLPRLKQENGDYLPSPRDVSIEVHDFDVQRLHNVGSVMLMEWGQFLAHDIVATQLDDEELTEDCCYDELVTGSDLHPDVLTGGPCFPIIISEGDAYFTNVSTRCMEFVRSLPVTDDNGVRQQMNGLSAYIDGSNVYGSNEEEMNALRSFSGGKLTVKNDDALPESTTNFCVTTDSDDYCLQSGDSRVNAYPGLGAVHTIFHRYHNYVADQLATNHADYDDETLFQEARKIVIAVMQRITYNEYLPMIIGQTAMTDQGLNDDWSYDDTCDASIYNVFVAAAFRFGHSMVPDDLLIDGERVNSVDLYLRPHYVLQSLDSLVQGLISENAERADRWYSEGITNQLFEFETQDGYDIAALNIQRGRDQGLPAYNKWREHCGLSAFTSFDEMNSARRYENAYEDVDDVDLYSGALQESGQGTVGETYQCLLGKQFKNLRNCDRFWYETTDSDIGFPDDRARRQIERTRLSHIICLTTGIDEIQPFVMRVPTTGRNTAETCDELLADGADYSRF